MLMVTMVTGGITVNLGIYNINQLQLLVKIAMKCCNYKIVH